MQRTSCPLRAAGQALKHAPQCAKFDCVSMQLVPQRRVPAGQLSVSMTDESLRSSA
jgi:hypothetical protein